MSEIKQIYSNNSYTDGIDTRAQYLVEGNKVDVYVSSTDQCTSTYVESSIYGTFVKIQLSDSSKEIEWVSIFGDPIPDWLDNLLEVGML